MAAYHRVDDLSQLRAVHRDHLRAQRSVRVWEAFTFLFLQLDVIAANWLRCAGVAADWCHGSDRHRQSIWSVLVLCD